MTTSQSLAKRPAPADSQLMPPPARPSKRIKRPATVLDEDTYEDALSHIVARDFFPGLAETESQQEYLDALSSKDRGWIKEAGRRLKEAMTPGRGDRSGVSFTPLRTESLRGVGGKTPRQGGWEAGTPATVASSATERTEKVKVDTSLSLNEFQARYTSEDNESFYKLLDKQNRKKDEKYGWLWDGNKIASSRQIAHREREQKLLEERKEAVKENGGKEVRTIEWTDERPAKPDAWVEKPDNAFMFKPESISEIGLPLRQDLAEEESRAGPKQTVYANTRLTNTADENEDQDQDDDAATTIDHDDSTSAIRSAIAGRPRLSKSEIGSTAAGDGIGNETPRVNGYSFVDSEDPEPSPPSSPTLSFAPADTTPNPFTIKENRRREDIHHRMVEKVAQAKRKKDRLSTLKTPLQGAPRFMSSPRIAREGMTPAGQKLMSRIGGAMTPKEANGMWGGRTPRAASALKGIVTASGGRK